MHNFVKGDFQKQMEQNRRRNAKFIWPFDI